MRQYIFLIIFLSTFSTNKSIGQQSIGIYYSLHQNYLFNSNDNNDSSIKSFPSLTILNGGFFLGIELIDGISLEFGATYSDFSTVKEFQAQENNLLQIETTQINYLSFPFQIAIRNATKNRREVTASPQLYFKLGSQYSILNKQKIAINESTQGIEQIKYRSSSWDIVTDIGCEFQLGNQIYLGTGLDFIFSFTPLEINNNFNRRKLITGLTVTLSKLL